MILPYTKPLVFNVFKPVEITSYDVIRHFKRNLPRGFGKIGHFGTLDPFACGVLLIGINGATKINNLIHDKFDKTYLAVGKLGVQTETGDLTIMPSQIDEGAYLKKEIAKFPKSFINEELNRVFIGEYLQAPHIYSASKFEGRPLHQWAREGVKIKKDKVKRFVKSIEVVKYVFPWLSIRVTVSSGTYVRTLFEDFARHLGTLGCLKALVRESIGPNHVRDSIIKSKWPCDGDRDFLLNGKVMNEVLPLDEIELDESTAKKYLHGIPFFHESIDTSKESKIWVKHQNNLIGMGEIDGEYCKVVFNLSQSVDISQRP